MVDPLERCTFVRWPDRVREEAAQAAMVRGGWAEDTPASPPASPLASSSNGEAPFTARGLVEAILVQQLPHGAPVERIDGGLHRALAAHEAGHISKECFLSEVKHAAKPEAAKPVILHSPHSALELEDD